jgi:hypothetical protein
MLRLARRPLAVALVAVLSTIASAGAAQAAPRPEDPTLIVLTPVATGVGPSIARSPVSDRRGEETLEQPLLLKPGGTHGKPGGGGGGTSDGALQTSALTALGTTAGPSFDGVGVGMGAYRPCCAPPDTNASVGPSQVVQWVNLDYAVFDKATGALTAGPFAGNSFWSGFTAGNCNRNNDGDPIIKFDAQAGRWFATQFSVTGGPPFFQCIAISSGADFLASSWTRYAYSFGSYFPDYPKLGVWTDAYYMSFNRFLNGVSFAGAAACAFDRSAMLAGSPTAAAQCFNSGTSIASLLPADLDGATGAANTTAAPPAGAPNVFAELGTNALTLFKFHVDFANSASSTFASASLAVPAFSKACGGGTCIAQAGTSNQLDSLADRLMYRLAYRNFGGYESLVVTHSVSGTGTAAPRWYELRSTGAQDFTLYQASTYAPDATYRWMGSAAMDKFGDLAIGYSASSATLAPSIRYAGRAAGDPLNALRAEGTIQAGAGSQTGSLHRWGDYSSLALDPADDCTFWYTTEYLKASGSFNWSTHLFAFKFPACQ